MESFTEKKIKTGQPSAWHRVYVALGSNMGDSGALLDDAVMKLSSRRDCRVGRVAGYLVTKPYGVIDQPDFLNSVLELYTRLTPSDLLDILHRIENEAGRKRVMHWGPRTLDLDILFYDDLVMKTETLTIPHPDLQNRDFVLFPMDEIAPDLVHPVFGKTMRELKEELIRKNGLQTTEV